MISPERRMFEFSTTTPEGILAGMQEIAPPHQKNLALATKEKLRDLTGMLVSLNRGHAEAEYNRFMDVKERSLDMPRAELQRHIQGKRVLVTGGTGCIGTELLNELRPYEPAHMTSLAITSPSEKVPGVAYKHVDIRDKEALKDAVREADPDIIYHVAAQRDPGLAEKAIHQTITTNIFGTHNLIEAARENDVQQVVYASTGKAMRPFTPDTYASSKKAGEALMADFAAERETLCSGVRFTHVVDNSLIFDKIQRWIDTDSPIRLHGADIPFYMQSAKESAQLLLVSGLEAEKKTFNIHVIRDLDWPVNLLDLAVGSLAKKDARTPIYICGYESGYEEQPYPGLYDPMFGGEVSPLINAFEASQTKQSKTCPQLDVFPFTTKKNSVIARRLERLEEVCKNDGNEAIHSAKDRLSWAMLDERLSHVPEVTLQRAANRARKLPVNDTEHRLTNEAIFRAFQNNLINWRK